DALGGVDDVVEVFLELLREEALDVTLEQAQGGALRLDDLPVADDLLLDIREVAYDFLGTPFEDVVLERVELVPDLVEDREAVVEEVVENFVEHAAGAHREEPVAEHLVLLAALEEPRQGQQLDRRPLALLENVLDVERMPAEALSELLGDLLRRSVEMDPGEPGGAELSGRARACGDRRDLAGARTTDARKARHGY